MAGSKTTINFHLVYDNQEDKAYWVLYSTASFLQERGLRYELIDTDAVNYEVVAKLAGPKPEVLVEEVTQPKQRTDNETQEDT